MHSRPGGIAVCSCIPWVLSCAHDLHSSHLLRSRVHMEGSTTEGLVIMDPGDNQPCVSWGSENGKVALTLLLCICVYLQHGTIMRFFKAVTGQSKFHKGTSDWDRVSFSDPATGNVKRSLSELLFLVKGPRKVFLFLSCIPD